jgi:hypothetical protein
VAILLDPFRQLAVMAGAAFTAAALAVMAVQRLRRWNSLGTGL